MVSINRTNDYSEKNWFSWAPDCFYRRKEKLRVYCECGLGVGVFNDVFTGTISGQ